MAQVLSVNVGVAQPTEFSTVGRSAIRKSPAHGPTRVELVTEPGRSGLVGDGICDVDHHGGPDQAVYVYAREDLDIWESRLQRTISPGVFGENITTIGLEVTEARIGERWSIGPDLLLEVTSARVPCRTFAGVMDDMTWVKTFTAARMPGAYLRVVTPGSVSAGDAITVVHTPTHDITVAMALDAKTTKRELLPYVATALGVSTKIAAKAARLSSDTK